MMRRLFQSPFAWLSVLLCLLAGNVLAEGTQTGVLAGKVVDTMGQPLPDVSVMLSGPQVERQALTDTEGRFRFPALSVGSYGISAELLGLEAQQSEIRVFIAKTVDVTLQLGEGGSEAAALPETRDLIQVFAVAPLIDRYETRVGASVSREFLDELPLERIYQSVASLLPGVTGNDEGNPNVGGALRSSNIFLVDGVDTTDSTTGLFGLNLSYEALADVDVTTAAPPTEYGRASGAVINVVTRSGDNDFRGSARWLLNSGSWNGDYTDPAPFLASELEAANSAGSDLDNTLAATLAGPLIPEHLFFFATFEQADSTFLRPTGTGELWDENTEIQSGAVKLTWPLGERHTLIGQLTTDSASFGTYAVFDRSPGENRAGNTPGRLRSVFLDRLPGDTFALQGRTQDGEFSKLEWGSVLTQNLTLTGTVATQDRRLERTPLNRRGVTSDSPHLGVVPFSMGPDTPNGTSTIFNGITDEGFEDRERDQGNLTAEAFYRSGRVDHSLRVGVDMQRTRSQFQFGVGGISGVDRITGRPVSGQLFIDFDTSFECFEFGNCVDFDPATGEFEPSVLLNFWARPMRETEAETLAIFANDSISFGRFLVSIGARFEEVTGEDDNGRKLVDDSSIAPRVGFKYDPKGDGKVLISATWSSFFEPFLQEYLDSFTRIDLFSGYTEYDWLGAFDMFDEFGELLPNECAAADPADINSTCWEFFGEEPFSAFQLVEPNLDLERSSVEELVISFERQLTTNTSLRLSWIQRDWQDLWDDRIQLLDGGFSVVGTTENLPEAERRYRGAQLFIQKRFANRWQLLASYTWSETEGNLFQANGLSTFADFSDTTNVNLTNRFGPAPYDRSNQLKVFANYQVPLSWGRLSLGSALGYQDGTPYQAEQFEDFGLRYLTPRGSLRLEDLWKWDLSVALDVPLAADIDLEFKFEAFNVTDEQSRLGVETDVDTGRFGLPRSISDLQRPRSLRLTVGLQF